VTGLRKKRRKTGAEENGSRTGAVYLWGVPAGVGPESKMWGSGESTEAVRTGILDCKECSKKRGFNGQGELLSIRVLSNSANWENEKPRAL